MAVAPDHVRNLTAVADTISAGAVVGSFFHVVPAIAALAATLWYTMQVWESHTVQKWVRLWARKRRTPPIRHSSGFARRARRKHTVREVLGEAAAHHQN